MKTSQSNTGNEHINKKIGRSFELIEVTIILFLLFVMSYQSIFTGKLVSYVDEVLIVLFFLIEFAKIIKDKSFKIFDKKVLLRYILLFLLILSSFITVLVRNYNFIAYLVEMFNYFKIIIIIECMLLSKINSNKLKKIMTFFILINIVSAAYGLARYFNIIDVGYISGEKFRNGVLRVAGFSGHPITMGFICMLIIVYIINFTKKSVKEYIVLGIMIITLLLSNARLATAVLIGYFIYILFLKTKRKKIMILAICLCAIFTTAITKNYIAKYLKADIEDTIRFYSIRKIPDGLRKYPIIGTGIGTYSCKVSFEYNSYVYEDLKFDNHFVILAKQTPNSAFESGWAKVIIETGIVGFLLMLLYFIALGIQLYRTQKTTALYLLVCYVLIAIFNPLYQIPYIMILSIFMSYNRTKKLKEGI